MTELAVVTPAAPITLPAPTKVVGLLNADMQECPHCHHTLVAQEIPADRRHLHLGFTPHGKPKEDDGRYMFYSHVVAQSSMVFDRTLAYTCPFCDTTDVIPGCEQMWLEDQAFWEARRIKEEPTKEDAAKRLAELDNTALTMVGEQIVEVLQSGDELTAGYNELIQAFEAECARRGVEVPFEKPCGCGCRSNPL
jgi:hypothetical protein